MRSRNCLLALIGLPVLVAPAWLGACSAPPAGDRASTKEWTAGAGSASDNNSQMDASEPDGSEPDASEPDGSEPDAGPSNCIFTDTTDSDGNAACQVAGDDGTVYGITDEACPSDTDDQNELCAEMPPAPSDTPTDFTDFVGRRFLPVRSEGPQAAPVTEVAWENLNSTTYTVKNSNSLVIPKTNLVQLGSSMMSTHNQTKNGPLCGQSTTADWRGLTGDDSTASPGWQLLWGNALMLGRTGFDSNQVATAAVGTQDSCKNVWQGPNSPANTGIQWLGRVGSINGLMVTEGGLINSQTNRAGDGWAETLAGVVMCSALDAVEPAVNQVLAGLSALVNVPTTSLPRVDTRRVWPAALNNWNLVLDTAANGGPPPGTWGRCFYGITLGKQQNGQPAKQSPALAAALKALASPNLSFNIEPLSDPPQNAVASMQAVAKLYQTSFVNPVKQVWLQYPYMDQAQIVLAANDLAILWNFLPNLLQPATLNLLLAAIGNVLTFNAVDSKLAPRVAQVTDDLNQLMYQALGCDNAPNPLYVKGGRPTMLGGKRSPAGTGHVALACGDPVMRTIITSNMYPGWGPASHQTTIKGGMPHESPAGALSMAALLNAGIAVTP